MVATLKMKNVTITGVSPELTNLAGIMDTHSTNSLMASLLLINGVIRVDPHRCTVDLGK